ncbi:MULTISPECIES: LysR substrate-binding domain-containing protein [Streptomyces]|uniref:LysR substrate-binding domain-containing protein n=1 Tax=Streptomyces TaxID=1883 RepID=UPI0007ECF75D|nr:MULTISPECIES: LysR substrate-binding domain-containing protein [unclassified Streptomyces]MCP3769265.1 LysR substrate-binding domain-containing protein [Streptomyces sp. MAR25Y5]OBQ50380.1 LysR family transcriptional regulator [Streptomyces sp. H-KF8]
MELRQLRYFLALAEECHFGRAAARLHVAQPALSQQIKQLERELGVSLFHRSTRRVEPTEAGRHLTDYARSLVAEEERARAHMRELATGRAGRVSVGFIGTATYDVLPRVARTVRAKLPGVTLDLRGEILTPRLVEGLLAGVFDLAVLRGAAPEEGVRVTPLRSEPLVAVLPSHHRLAGRPSVPLEDLAGEPFVIHPSQSRSSMYDRVLSACRRAGFRPDPLLEVGETATLVVLVAAGHGVALVPQSVRSLSLDGVTYVPLADPEPVELVLARRTHRVPAAVEQVASVIEDCVRG